MWVSFQKIYYFYIVSSWLLWKSYLILKSNQNHPFLCVLSSTRTPFDNHSMLFCELPSNQSACFEHVSSYFVIQCGIRTSHLYSTTTTATLKQTKDKTCQNADKMNSEEKKEVSASAAVTLIARSSSSFSCLHAPRRAHVVKTPWCPPQTWVVCLRGHVTWRREYNDVIVIPSDVSFIVLILYRESWHHAVDLAADNRPITATYRYTIYLTIPYVRCTK